MALLVVALAGCVNKRVDGNATVLTNALWVPSLFVVGSMVVGFLSYSQFNARSWLYGSILAIVALVLLVGGAPSYLLEKVTVSPDGFHANTGWLGAEEYDVRYDDVASMDHTSETRRGRRGRTNTYHYLIVHLRNGEDIRLNTTNGVCHEAEPLIVDGAKAHGVEFHGVE